MVHQLWLEGGNTQTYKLKESLGIYMDDVIANDREKRQLHKIDVCYKKYYQSCNSECQKLVFAVISFYGHI